VRIDLDWAGDTNSRRSLIDMFFCLSVGPFLNNTENKVLLLCLLLHVLSSQFPNVNPNVKNLNVEGSDVTY
jgi:hypothetical protein